MISSKFIWSESNREHPVLGDVETDGAENGWQLFKQKVLSCLVQVLDAEPLTTFSDELCAKAPLKRLFLVDIKRRLFVR
jgi:hypothetical protein